MGIKKIEKTKGIVSRCQNDRGVTTLLKLVDGEEFDIEGSHRIDRGENIELIHTAPFGINQVHRYKILDEEDNTLFSYRKY